MEYYDGILILTSDRVGSFDAAFRSRIHLALHFSSLDKSARALIWRNFFERLHDQDKDIDYPDLINHLNLFASENFNGRQIRNAVSTALQLAAYRKQSLNSYHVSQTIRASQDFNRYLEDLQSFPLDDIAYR